MTPRVGVKSTQPISNVLVRRSDSLNNRKFPGSDNPGDVSSSQTKVLADIERAKEIHRGNLQRQVDKMDTHPTQKGISATWKLSCMEHSEGKTVVSDFNTTSFYKFTSGFKAHHLSDSIGIVEFIDWVIENWSMLPSCGFKWFSIATYPPVPSFAYFAKMYKYFIRTYSGLEERGELHQHRIELASGKADSKKEIARVRLQNQTLQSEVKHLKQNEQHLHSVIQERSTRKPRKKLPMKPVDELDFESIQPLPAL